MRCEEPAEVTTGWNGIAAFDADLVLPSIPTCSAMSLRARDGVVVFDANWFLPSLASCLYRKLATPPSVPSSSRLAFRGDTPWSRSASPSRACTTCTCEFDKMVVFFNDGIESIICLFETAGGEFDLGLVCVLDWDAIGLYEDVCVIRDSCANAPRRSGPTSRTTPSPSPPRLRREQPVEVAVRWSGAVIFDAN
ncbi:hypothetical protein DFH06DRAFT_1406918 [Mycena polygramma]|nr:hypothetical protein DFH06DRAFT_1406918 [Mycena polygramma]